MLLRIPPENVADECARERICAIPLTVRTRERAEPITPFRALVQGERIVHGVSALVAHVAHGFDVVFHTPRHLALDAFKPLVDEIERDADQRRPVGAPPLIAEVDWRPETNTLRVEFQVELVDEALDARTLNPKTEVRDFSTEQGVALVLPGCLIIHGGDKGKAYTEPMKHNAAPLSRRRVRLGERKG